MRNKTVLLDLNARRRSCSRALTVYALRASALLIGSAFVLTIAGNRWTSYIKSPIPGIYLVDLLLLLGVLATIPAWREARSFTRWVYWTYGAVIAYALVVLAPEILEATQDDRLLAVRDAAPFLYFALVPAAAITLRRVNAKTGIYAARSASALAALGTMLLHVGILQPFPSPILGSDFASIFGYRTDLTGAALAIGMVAWGAWPSQSVRGWLSIQVTYVAVAATAGSSRSGLVAVLVGILVIAYRQRQVVRGLLVVVTSILILALGILYGGVIAGSLGSPLSVTAPSNSAPDTELPVTTVPSLEEPVTPPSTPEKKLDTPPPATDVDVLADRVTRVGTVTARLSTWTDVVLGLGTNGTWLLGGAAGSDYLYELCTGIPVAPESIWLETGDPKCAVDDYGPEPVVRDPHNWVLNIAITHGLLGLAVFVFAIGSTLWRGRRSEIYPLAGWTIGFFLVTGMTFLISAGYALLPMAVGAAWIVSRVGFKHRA